MTDTIPEQLQRRREAASRREPLDCGHRDPLDCIDVCSDPEGDEKGSGLVRTPGGEQPEFDAAYLAFWRERARHELVLDSIKASLEAQPSKAAVRACKRRWVAAVVAAAETVAKNMEDTE